MSSASSQDEPWALHNGDHRLIELLSASEQTWCTLVMWDSQWMTVALHSTFCIYIHQPGYSTVVGSRSCSCSEASFIVLWKVCLCCSICCSWRRFVLLCECRSCPMQGMLAATWSEIKVVWKRKEKSNLYLSCLSVKYRFFTHHKIVWNMGHLCITKLSETWVSYTTKVSETWVFNTSENSLKHGPLTHHKTVWNMGL